MSSLSTKTNNKRSRNSSTSTTLDLGWKGSSTGKDNNDDEIDSEDDDDSLQENRRHLADDSSDSEDEEEETLEAKKVRLAREYLQKIERGVDESDSSSHWHLLWHS